MHPRVEEDAEDVVEAVAPISDVFHEELRPSPEPLTISNCSFYRKLLLTVKLTDRICPSRRGYD